VEALRGVHEKGSAGPKRAHETLFPAALFRRRKIFQHFIRKDGVRGFVKVRKGLEPLACCAYEEGGGWFCS